MLSRFLGKVRRAETPFFRVLKNMGRAVLRAELPLPKFVRAPFALAYYMHFAVIGALRRTISFFYRSPLFRAMCDEVGPNLYVEQVPEIQGHVRIRIGENVTISGNLTIMAGRVHSDPEIVLGNKVFLGHQVTLQVAQRITIEEGAAVSGGTLVADNDAHPVDVGRRLSGELPGPEEVKAVRIGRYAWIGKNCIILKGVTIGDGALVGAGSVVSNDIPPFAVAMGNPARIVKKLEPPAMWPPAAPQE